MSTPDDEACGSAVPFIKASIYIPECTDECADVETPLAENAEKHDALTIDGLDSAIEATLQESAIETTFAVKAVLAHADSQEALMIDRLSQRKNTKGSGGIVRTDSTCSLPIPAE